MGIDAWVIRVMVKVQAQISPDQLTVLRVRMSMRRSIFESAGFSVPTDTFTTRPETKKTATLVDPRTTPPSAAPSRTVKLDNGMIFKTVRGDIYKRAVRGKK